MTRGEWVKVNGLMMHVRHSHKKQLRCSVRGCFALAAFECDWRLGHGKTCDRGLCTEHTHKPAEGKDLCPDHAKAWADKLTNGGQLTLIPTGRL